MKECSVYEVTYECKLYKYYKLMVSSIPAISDHFTTNLQQMDAAPRTFYYSICFAELET